MKTAILVITCICFMYIPVILHSSLSALAQKQVDTIETKTLNIIEHNDKALITIHYDGRVELNGISLDSAALLFWEQVAESFPDARKSICGLDDNTYVTARDMPPCIWKHHFPTLKMKVIISGKSYYMDYEEYTQFLLTELCPDGEIQVKGRLR